MLLQHRSAKLAAGDGREICTPSFGLQDRALKLLERL